MIHDVVLPDTSDDGLETLHIAIPDDYVGQRLDRTIADLCPDYSRTRLQGLIDAGECLLNGRTCTTSSRKVEQGDVVTMSLPPLVDALPEPENIPLDIVFEDDDLLVINKPVGMVVLRRGEDSLEIDDLLAEVDADDALDRVDERDAIRFATDRSHSCFDDVAGDRHDVGSKIVELPRDDFVELTIESPRHVEVGDVGDRETF